MNVRGAMRSLDIALSLGAAGEGGARMPLGGDCGRDDMIPLCLSVLYVADVTERYSGRIV